MAQQKDLLIIALNGPQQPIYWCKGNPADDSYQQAGLLDSENLDSSIFNQLNNCKVMVLVPSHSVILRTFSFQGASRSVTPQMIAYQYEEELLDHIERLEWLILAKQGTNYTLAGFRKEDMQYWLAQLSELAIEPDLLLPSVVALPFNGKAYHIKWHQHLLFKTGQFAGYGLPANWPVEQLVVDSVPLTAEPNQSFTDLLWSLAKVTYPKRCTLLQAQYSVRPRWLRGGSWALVAGIILLLSGLAVQSISYQHEISTINKQMLSSYQQLLVTKEQPANPLLALQTKTKQLQNNLTQVQFFDLAQQAQQVLHPLGKVKVTKLAFSADKGELNLVISAEHLQSFRHTNEMGSVVDLTKLQTANQGVLSIKGEQ